MRAAVRRSSRRHQENEDATPKDDTGGVAVAGAGCGELGQAARQALAEAEKRRRPGALNQPAARKEINGRDGPEPVRYCDWEVRGIASDF